MKPSQVAELLARIASFDRRTTGETDVLAWHAAIGDLDYGDCEQAVISYFQDSREWLMPVDIRQRVKAMRKDRLNRLVTGAPDANPDDVNGYLTALRAGRFRPYVEPETVTPITLGPAFKQLS